LKKNLNYKEAQLILDQYEARSMHGQLPVLWKKALGDIVVDSENKKYIDFTSTIFVANIGHSNISIKIAILRVVFSNLLHSYTYLNKFRVKYIESLVKFCGPSFEKAYLASSGTEATETSLKLMRMYGLKVSKKKKPGIISIKGNYHGRTLGAFMMSGFPDAKWWIGFKDPNIYFINFPYPWEINEKNGSKFFKDEIEKLKNSGVNVKTDISGIILESFQGWGALFYPKSFITEIKKFCKKNQILITFDEMQAGFYRTGKKFGFNHYNINPDIICIGKGMGSGMPLSGVVSTKKILDLPGPGELSSTNSANPLVCSAGLATLNVMNTSKFLNSLERNCKIFKEKLNEIELTFKGRIKVYGKGMIKSIIFYDKEGKPDIKTANDVVEDLLQNKLLVVKTGRESIKLGPPLNMSKKNLVNGLAIINKSLKKILNDTI